MVERFAVGTGEVINIGKSTFCVSFERKCLKDIYFALKRYLSLNIIHSLKFRLFLALDFWKTARFSDKYHCIIEDRKKHFS